MRALLCLCVVSVGFVACSKETPKPPSDAPVARATKPTKDTPPAKTGASRLPPTLKPSTLPPSQDAWFWSYLQPDDSLGHVYAFYKPTGPRVWSKYHHEADGRARLVLALDREFKSVQNTVTFKHPKSTSSGVHWAEDKDTVYVVSYPHYLPGATVVAVDAKTLKTKWTARTSAHQPLSIGGEVQALSERYNMVQIRVVKGELLIYGRQGKAPFIEVLDKSSGQFIRKGSVSYALVDEFWDHNAFEQKVKHTNPKSLAASTSGEDAMYLFDYNAIQTETYPTKAHPTRHVRNPVVRIRKVSATNDSLWQYDYKFRGSQTRIYAVECNQTLFVAKYNRAATGVTILALDAKTGKQQWKAHPHGVGSIGHSKWSNEVVLSCAEEGHLKVWGRESAPFYMELLDFKTGKTLSNTQMIFKKRQPTCNERYVPRD